MKICKSCPRCCKVDRINTLGFCQKGREIEVAKIIEDFCYEEPCLSKKGLVAIFFAGCNLRCEYCQNIEISRQFKGKVYSNLEFAKLLKSYDERKLKVLIL